MTPEDGKTASIAENNYDGGSKFWKQMERKGKTDCAFRICILEELVEDWSDERNVHLFKGDLYLEDYEWTVVDVGKVSCLEAK